MARSGPFSSMRNGGLHNQTLTILLQGGPVSTWSGHRRIQCVGKPLLFSGVPLIVGTPATCDAITFLRAAPYLRQHNLIRSQALYSVLNVSQSQHWRTANTRAIPPCTQCH